MFGYQQHDGPSREYSEALARIAALDNNKLNGVEIPVPIEVVFEKQDSMAKNLAPLLRLQGVGEIIRHGCEEKALPVVEAGAFRCTFVLSATKAELVDVHDLMDMDMAKKTEDLIHNNVLFSRVSVQVHFEERYTTQRREALGRILTSLFDTTRRLYDSLTRPFEADSHAPTTSRKLDQISLSTFVRYGRGRNDWDALFSAAILNQTTRELKLCYTAPIWHSKYWWQWLAYAVFSKRARTHSSLEVLSLNQIANMTTATMDAFAAILSSERPEELLLGCSAGPTGVQDATLAADSPIQWDFDQQNKPVLSSEVLKLSSPIPFLRILSENEESEWVDAIVPGYGRCQVRRDNLVLSDQVETGSSVNNLNALEIYVYSCDCADISSLPLFLAAVGSSLKMLRIDAVM